MEAQEMNLFGVEQTFNQSDMSHMSEQMSNYVLQIITMLSCPDMMLCPLTLSYFEIFESHFGNLCSFRAIYWPCIRMQDVDIRRIDS